VNEPPEGDDQRLYQRFVMMMMMRFVMMMGGLHVSST
jgi:hypothetical protein